MLLCKMKAACSQPGLSAHAVALACALWFSAPTLNAAETTGTVLTKTIFRKAPIADPLGDDRTTTGYYCINWADAPAIDGTFMLLVNSAQLILRSGHENPNPDFIYWFTDLKPGQYRPIEKALTSSRASRFEPDGGTWREYQCFTCRGLEQSPWYEDSDETTWRWSCANTLLRNVNAVLTELNSTFPPEVPKLPTLHIMDILDYSAVEIKGGGAFLPARKNR